MKQIKIGRSIVNFYYDNFEYFQPNKHTCGDCALRAVSKVLNKDWETVFDDVIPIARKMQRMPNDVKVIGKYLESKGFKWEGIKPQRGEARPTVANFAKNNPDKICVLRVSHHLTSSENGKYYDIWDCGDKALSGYWYKNKK